MAIDLQVSGSNITGTPKYIKAEGGTDSSLSISTDEIGIGTESPDTKLEVDGVVRITTSTGTNYLEIGAYDSVNDNFGYVSSGGQTNGTGLKLETTNGSGGGYATRVTIQNDGKVGAGTESPDKLLSISDTSNQSQAIFGQDKTGRSQINVGTEDATDGSAVLGFDDTAGSEYASIHIAGDTFGSALVVAKGGNVGVNTTSPSEKLEVDGNIKAVNIIADKVESPAGAPVLIESPSGQDLTITSGGEININPQGDFKIHLANSVFQIDDTVTSNNLMGINRATGNVLIGVGDPTTITNTLVVNGTVEFQDKIELLDGGDLILRLSEDENCSMLSGAGLGLGFKTNGTQQERLVITMNGDVGIGPFTPGSKLHVQDTTTSRILVETTGVSSFPGLSLKNTGRTWLLQNQGNDNNKFIIHDETAVATRLAIDSLGRVGLGGNTAPDKTLTVNGDVKIRVEDKFILGTDDNFIKSTGNGNLTLTAASTEGNSIDFTFGVSETAHFDNNGLKMASGKDISLGNNDSVVFGTAGAFIKWDSTGAELEFEGKSHFLDDVGIGASPTGVFEVNPAQPLSAAVGKSIILSAQQGKTNNDGGDVVINGGALDGTGSDGNVILADLRGNVGIGTDDPNFRLTVKGEQFGISALFGDLDIIGSSNLYFRAAEINANYFDDNDGNGVVINGFGFEGGDTRFRDFSVRDGKSNAASSVLMYITGSTGNVGIGVAEADTRLHINSFDTGATGPVLTIQHNSTSAAANDVPGKILIEANDDGVPINSHFINEIDFVLSDPTKTSMDSFILFKTMNNVNNGDTNTTASLTSNGVWTDASGAESKEYVKKYWNKSVCEMLKKLPLGVYHSKGAKESKKVYYGGPTAEDFYKIFNLGENPEKSIPGIAPKNLAAVGLMAISEIIDDNEKLKNDLAAIKEKLGLKGAVKIIKKAKATKKR